jgi:phosphopentomutase
VQRRVFLIVLDSLGVGAMPDADRFGDAGTHTLDHLVQAAGGLDAPRLLELGLGNVPGVDAVPAAGRPVASFGRMEERSPGKDTSTGHWEMVGCVLETEFPVYSDGFPPEVIEPFLERTGLPGILGNEAASGTEIIERLGAEHVATGKPIVYTSADSVFQVAAHEEAFGLERLLEICRVARELLDPLGVGRVIARPFIGEPGSYQRTYNRRDFSLLPPADNSLTRLVAAGVPVVGVGKIEDIYAGIGVTESLHSEGNDDGMRIVTECARERETGLVFVNLVDFDMLYGHRRDPKGYREALERFDRQYLELEAALRPGDVVIMTADHGNDPTFTQTTDHTREYVPLLVHVAGAPEGVDLGTRATFADLGATVEELFGLEPKGPGRSFAADLPDPGVRAVV